MTISELKKDAKVKLSGGYSKALAISLVYFFIVFVLNSIMTIIKSNIFVLIFSILVAIISIPLSFGMIASIIKIIRNEDVSIFDFISIGLKNFKGVWRTYLRTMVRLILPIILMVASYIFVIFTLFQAVAAEALSGSIPANVSNMFLVALIVLAAALIFFVYKSFSYALTMYILYDKPTATGKEINDESAKLMKGNKSKLFFLTLSFIGWFFLIALVSSLAYVLLGEFIGVLVSALGSILLTPYISASLVCFYDDLKSNDEPVKEAE